MERTIFDLRDATQDQIEMFSIAMYLEHHRLRADIFHKLENLNNYHNRINKVICRNGEVMGFVSYTYDEDEVCVKRIYILDGCRRCGIARYMIWSIAEGLRGISKVIKIKTWTYSGYRLFTKIGLTLDSIGNNGELYMSMELK